VSVDYRRPYDVRKVAETVAESVAYMGDVSVHEVWTVLKLLSRQTDLRVFVADVPA